MLAQHVLDLDQGADRVVVLEVPDVDGVDIGEVVHRAQLRRARLAPAAGPAQTLSIGDVVIDPVKPSLKKGDAAVHLTKTEWDLLRALMKHTGRTLAQIESETDRDNFMSAAEAKEYGLVDTVLERIPNPPVRPTT